MEKQHELFYMKISIFSESSQSFPLYLPNFGLWKQDQPFFFCNHRYTSSCKQKEPVVPKEVYSLEGIFLPQDWFLYTFAFINLSLPPFAPSLYLHPSIALSLHYLPIYSYFTQSTSLHLFYYHLFLLSFLNLSLFFPHVSFSHFIKTAHLDPFSVHYTAAFIASVKTREHLISFVEINLPVYPCYHLPQQRD